MSHFFNSSNQVSFENVMKIGIKLITLLESLHSIGYIHKDLKTANILIGDYNCVNSISNVRLIDFGLATPYTNTGEMRKPRDECEHISFGPAT